MATKSFAIRTEPHTADVGGVQLLFVAETLGSEFAEAYSALREAQQKVTGRKASSTKHAKEEAGTDPAALKELHEAMRGFVRGFLLPESHAAFDGLRLPDRVLVQLLEWTAELYGSGAGNDDGGQSSD